jgi:hypothetical protein
MLTNQGLRARCSASVFGKGVFPVPVGPGIGVSSVIFTERF